MKPEYRISTFIILFIFVAAPCYSEGLSHIPGAFVDIGYGARPMGMGGAFTGLADDHNAVMWNPAGMCRVQGNGISFMWAKQFGFVPYNYLSYSRELGKDYRIGAGVIFSGDEVLSESTTLVSFASPLTRAWYKLSDVYLGLSVKLRWASFGNNSDGDADRVTGDAFGYGFDFGIMVIPNDKFSAGLLFRDLVNDITWNSSSSGKYSESVPEELTIGFSYKPTSRSIVAFDLRKALYKDVEDRIIIGVEQQLFGLLKLRAGWGRSLSAEYSNQDIALGLGLYRAIGKLDFMFDFAYMLNDLKNTPRVGASINW
ncbi:hypothetical protein ISS30_00190 [bacterium]|nr:hypothetical protein [FCB group bacterium]MBL7190088.1 hypothetical protein [bacterium]